jgi:carnitine-CoA ligase
MSFDHPAGQTVNETFRAAAAAGPDALFLDFSGERYSYGRLDEEVARLARGLHALGVERGDRVVTLLDNGPDAVISWLAVNRLGGVNVPVNTAYKDEFLRHQIADSGARVTLVEGDYLERVRAVSAGAPELRHAVSRVKTDINSTARLAVSVLDEHRLDQGLLPNPELAPRDLSALIYTSGTTGPSKGCMCSHNYLCDQGFRLTEMAQREAADLSWTPLPLFHIFAIATVVSTAQLRGSASIAPRFSVSGFWPEVERTGATVVSLLGAMGVLLANAPDTEASRRCRGQIRSVLAVPFPAALKQTWRERFGVRWPGFNVYGQTEAGSMITAPVDLDVPDGSAGRRNETLDVRIFDADDRECGPDEVGEIVVRPNRPHVMFEGFWNRPDLSHALARNYWHHTGDLGKFDREGYFYFVDRQKDYLRRRGENISSFEVEISLMAHPGIAEAAVYAVDSELTEDDVKATVVLAPGTELTPEDLIRWAAERIPYFALPRYVEFRAELPKNPVGRVLKFQLRERGVTPDTWDREKFDLDINRR